MSWVTDTLQKSEQNKTARARRDELLLNLSRMFLSELEYAVQTDIEEINKARPDIFNRHINSHLKIMGGMIDRLDVMCGPNTVLAVEYCSNPPSLKVTRMIVTGQFGSAQHKTQHYFFNLDSEESLYLETKQGKDTAAIPADQVSQELLGFIVAGL